jgi:hypothetical protein
LFRNCDNAGKNFDKGYRIYIHILFLGLDMDRISYLFLEPGYG